MDKKSATIIAVAVILSASFGSVTNDLFAGLFNVVWGKKDLSVEEQKIKTFKVTKTYQDVNNAPNNELLVAELSKEAEILSMQAMVTERFFPSGGGDPPAFITFVRFVSQPSQGEPCTFQTHFSGGETRIAQSVMSNVFCGPSEDKQIYIENTSGPQTQGAVDLYISYIQH